MVVAEPLLTPYAFTVIFKFNFLDNKTPNQLIYFCAKYCPLFANENSFPPCIIEIQNYPRKTNAFKSLSYRLGKLEKENLGEKITEIEKEITRLKSNVKSFMDDKYAMFTSKLMSDQHLVANGEKLLEEMNTLHKKIDDQVEMIKISGAVLISYTNVV